MLVEWVESGASKTEGKLAMSEPLICSAGGIPYNKPHLDAKDAEIERLRARVAQLEQHLAAAMQLAEKAISIEIPTV